MQPKRLGKYLLLDRLAVGGMAEVYRGKLIGEQGFEKLVVIKQMLPQVAAKDEMVTAFVDEARLAALLQHENIIHVYDFGEMGGGYFIAMEYLFGKELRAVLDKSLEAEHRIALPDCLYVAARICDGLHYAHELKDLHQRPLNIIHRDISPQNIFITYDGKIKIIDFGIAKTSVQSVRTQTGLVKGKLAYMSPEQARGSKLDRRSDIFATGAVLYEMLTGCRMYQGTDTAQVLQKVIEADFPAPESIRPDIPAPVCAVLKQALSKQEADRYENAGQMLADIEECMFALSLRGNAQSLSVEMKGLFEAEFAAETEDIQRVIDIDASADAAMAAPENGVSLPGGSGTQTSAHNLDGGGTRTETVSLPSDQDLSAARNDAAPEPPRNGRQNAGAERSRPERRSSTRTTVLYLLATVLVVSSMVWLLSWLKQNTTRAPVSETTLAKVAGARQESPKVPPETGETPLQRQKPVGIAPQQQEEASGTDTAAEASGAQPANETGEAAEPATGQSASTPAEGATEAKEPPPIKHIESRSKQVASAHAVAIKALLANAEKNLRKYRLTTPENDCAYFYFREVLRMDPRNVEARKGIGRIADAYGRLADSEISRSEYEKAKVYVDKGLKVSPKNAHLSELEKELARPRPLRFFDDVGKKIKNLFD